MSDAFFQTPVVYLKGVGDQRAVLLQKELNIQTYGDLLHHFPFRYVDKSHFHQFSEIHPDLPFVQLRGKIGFPVEEGVGRKKRLKVTFTDGKDEIDLVWFQGIKWVKPTLQPGKEFIVFGKVVSFKGRYSIPHPELEIPVPGASFRKAPVEPVYSTTEKLTARGLNSRGIFKLIQTLIPLLPGKIPETLPDPLIREYKLMVREEAFIQVHQPHSPEQIKAARRRLKFEEFFFLQLSLLRQKLINQRKVNGIVFEEVGEFFNTFYRDHLPFELTGAQKRVLKEIRKDMRSGNQMNRLLQGDVGSGKTLVALLSMLLAIDNGYQTSLMAPTEILANQHFETISEFLGDMGIPVALLTGSTRAAKRRVLHEGLENGEIKILIGTHALIEEKVKFKNLGLAVIDEQHRFGVAQRARFWEKNNISPHILVMTATPIPRTLAMTLYGDLDVSVIDELPPGRKPIKTIHRTDASRLQVFQFLRDEIAKGRQVYIVYPLIEESEKLDYKNLIDGYESICRSFPRPQYQVSIVHGQMKPADKDYEMQQFARGKTQIMVATTVIEVGVNVPNASVMIIESAERFGLSQLHQLRGRVGRGAEQSFCILVTQERISADAKERIKTMVATNDGFKIAEADLKLRGPGNILGTQQSGIPQLKIGDLMEDNPMLIAARKIVIKLLEDDPDLTKPENAPIVNHLQAAEKYKAQWARIS